MSVLLKAQTLFLESMYSKAARRIFLIEKNSSNESRSKQQIWHYKDLKVMCRLETPHPLQKHDYVVYGWYLNYWLSTNTKICEGCRITNKKLHKYIKGTKNMTNISRILNHKRLWFLQLEIVWYLVMEVFRYMDGTLDFHNFHLRKTQYVTLIIILQECPVLLLFQNGFWPPKLFLWGTNRFGQVQIRLFWTNFHNLDLCKIIWTRIEQIGAIQNDWYQNYLDDPKLFWTHRHNSINLCKTKTPPIQSALCGVFPKGKWCKMQFCRVFRPNYSIVKDSSADLGVNPKIVQIRPSVNAVCTKISKKIFFIFVNIFIFLRENTEVAFFIFWIFKLKQP